MLAKVALGVTSMTSVAAGTCAYRLFRQSRTDQLTGLGNRAALVAGFNRAMKRGRGLVGVAVGDMNGFKAFNDVHGHRFGDQVLIAVAAKLRDTARRGEVPVRLHGDEFAVLLPSISTPEQAEHRVREFQAAVSTITELDGQPVEVAMSLGVMTAPAAKAQLPALLASADDRMYADKHTSRQHTARAVVAA
ncbi:diguanylate cyclase (GGDEF) domain-containing protein [Saccharopolyspora kobensis]|uniref:Diguanylate cyclase (GGDEF) domain-containing protein n=1 Tax=Saccharopolyspora kobensis TaxID=146035 RepID=A0A1H6DZ24_9PSEU|nr:GGDEF domain-containing protein [Saccharopolyspora kobensis]SEG90592.1 diguanylate cyclase (GGDEF) domain-containing protein [Saccharopolyspora kobensis]SFD92342.1 diguanylate cyclase (GGDEF) domain-containing protein [Saccharopolyspora kobensis]